MDTFTIAEVRKHFDKLSYDTVNKYVLLHKDQWEKLPKGKVKGDFKALVQRFAENPKYRYKDGKIDAYEERPVQDEAELFALLASENERLRKENERLRDFGSIIEQTIKSVSFHVKPPKLMERKIDPIDFPVHVVCHFGDQHGAHPELTDTYIKKATKLLSSIRSNITGFWAVHTGDDQDGTNIYPGQAYHVLYDNTEQMERVAWEKIKIMHWGRQFSENLHAVQADGNHARSGVGRGGPAHPNDNWDRASGRFARSHTDSFAEWHFIPERKLFAEVNIGGLATLVTHGHHIKAQLKTPHYGIDRWSMAAVDYVSKEFRYSPKMLMLGHHHRLFCTFVGSTIVSMPGSLQDFSVYAQELGAVETPKAQGLLLIKADDKPRLWGWHPIFVEE